MTTTIATVSWRDGLSKADRALMEEITGKVKTHLGQSVEFLYLAGCELQRSRVVLKEEHRWVDWINTEFKPGWRTTAWRLMTLAEKLEKPYHKGLLSQFATSATYELCKSDEAMERAIEAAEAGETITHPRAKELVREQRAEEMLAADAALNNLPPDAQKRIRKQAREKAIRDERARKLETVARHLEAVRAIGEQEKDVKDSTLEKLDEVLEEFQKALGD